MMYCVIHSSAIGVSPYASSDCDFRRLWKGEKRIVSSQLSCRFLKRVVGERVGFSFDLSVGGLAWRCPPSGVAVTRVGGHPDLPAGGHHEDTTAIAECDRSS
jgi:hypothetical protein